MTTTAGKKKPVRARHDRWADWAVIGTLAVALLLGWAVMALAQGGSATFADADTDLVLKYPKGWFLKEDDRLVFQALDPASGRFRTTYQVRSWPLAATEEMTSTLAAVLNNAALARAQEGTAFRTFDIVQGDELDGLPTMESTYVFVAESTDMFTQRMPVVGMGLDIAVGMGDQAYVFSLVAAEDAFEAAEPAFRRFVKNAEIR